MAIEDAGALGVLFNGIETSQVEDRLALFEKIRYNRASRVQLLSRARVGEEMTVEAQVRRYAESPDICERKSPSSFPEFQLIRALCSGSNQSSRTNHA